MIISSLALAAGGIFAVSAVTPASAATTTGSPQTQSAVHTSDWGGWDHGGWGGWDHGGWDHGGWGGWDHGGCGWDDWGGWC